MTDTQFNYIAAAGLGWLIGYMMGRIAEMGPRKS